MIKLMITALVTLWAAAVTATTATTETNVLQNITLQLTIYEQGVTNATGTKVADKVMPFNTESLITALGTVAGVDFGPSARLVKSTVFSNVTITTGPGVFSTVLSTNLSITTSNGYLSIGAASFYGIYGDAGIVTISNNTFTTSGGGGNITTNVVSTSGPTIQSVTIDTDPGFITTLTPTITNGVTDVAIVTLQQVSAAPTESVLTNVSSSIDILYGGAANTPYSVNNYLSFSPISPAEIVVQSGIGLNTTNALTVENLGSQTGFSIQGFQLGFAGPTNLTFSLQGFVKQALKVDLLSARGTNRIYEDIFGANSTWNANGFGYIGGAFTTNQTSVPILGGFLTNASPIVVEGAINMSFLKNLAQ